MICEHCEEGIRETPDPGVPYVHEHSGNSYCDVTSVEEAVERAGEEGRTEAWPRRTLELLHAEILASLDETYDLVYVHQGDKLSDEQIRKMVRGEDWWNDPDLEEFVSESMHESASNYAKSAIGEVSARWRRDFGDLGYLDELFEEYENSDKDELVLEIKNRDSGSYVSDLISGTGTVTLRVCAISEDNAWSNVEVTAQDVIDELSLPATEKNVALIQEALGNASPEYSLIMGYWVFNVDLDDINKLPAGDDASNDAMVEVVNPMLFLGNPFSGSGFLTDDQLEATIQLRRGDLRTDRDAFGYSVDEIYGGLHGAGSDVSEVRAIVPLPTIEELLGVAS